MQRYGQYIRLEVGMVFPTESQSIERLVVYSWSAVETGTNITNTIAVHLKPTSAKCILVTGSLQQYMRGCGV